MWRGSTSNSWTERPRSTLPARITVWEGVLGYDLHTTSQPGANPNDVQLTIAD